MPRARSLKAVRLWAHRGGSAAVEFGFVSIPLIATCLFIFQTVYNFFISSHVDFALQKAARIVTLGHAPASQQGFTRQICAAAPGLSNCANNLLVDVSVTHDFLQSYVGMNGRPFPTLASQTNYDLGGPGDFVVIQVFYSLPQLASLNILGGKMSPQFRSATVVRNDVR